jgi:hypothetical protein
LNFFLLALGFWGGTGGATGTIGANFLVLDRPSGLFGGTFGGWAVPVTDVSVRITADAWMQNSFDMFLLFVVIHLFVPLKFSTSDQLV